MGGVARRAARGRGLSELAILGITAAIVVVIFVAGLAIVWVVGSPSDGEKPESEPTIDAETVQTYIDTVEANTEEVRRQRLATCRLLDELGADSTSGADQEACG